MTEMFIFNAIKALAPEMHWSTQANIGGGVKWQGDIQSMSLHVTVPNRDLLKISLFKEDPDKAIFRAWSRTAADGDSWCLVQAKSGPKIDALSMWSEDAIVQELDNLINMAYSAQGLQRLKDKHTLVLSDGERIVRKEVRSHLTRGVWAVHNMRDTVGEAKTSDIEDIVWSVDHKPTGRSVRSQLSFEHSRNLAAWLCRTLGESWQEHLELGQTPAQGELSLALQEVKNWINILNRASPEDELWDPEVMEGFA